MAELNSQLKPVIQFMIQKMNEPVSSLDIVNLYFNNVQERLELPLSTVLPLLVKAYVDDERFARNYQGNWEECLNLARQDRPNRLISLFRCFQRAQKGHMSYQHPK